jgi:hypothetical protein
MEVLMEQQKLLDDAKNVSKKVTKSTQEVLYTNIKDVLAKKYVKLVMCDLSTGEDYMNMDVQPFQTSHLVDQAFLVIQSFIGQFHFWVQPIAN